MLPSKKYTMVPKKTQCYKFNKKNQQNQNRTSMSQGNILKKIKYIHKNNKSTSVYETPLHPDYPKGAKGPSRTACWAPTWATRWSTFRGGVPRGPCSPQPPASRAQRPPVWGPPWSASGRGRGARPCARPAPFAGCAAWRRTATWSVEQVCHLCSPTRQPRRLDPSVWQPWCFGNRRVFRCVGGRLVVHTFFVRRYRMHISLFLTNVLFILDRLDWI